MQIELIHVSTFSSKLLAEVAARYDLRWGQLPLSLHRAKDLRACCTPWSVFQDGSEVQPAPLLSHLADSVISWLMALISSLIVSVFLKPFLWFEQLAQPLSLGTACMTINSPMIKAIATCSNLYLLTVRGFSRKMRVVEQITISYSEHEYKIINEIQRDQ